MEDRTILSPVLPQITLFRGGVDIRLFVTSGYGRIVTSDNRSVSGEIPLDALYDTFMRLLDEYPKEDEAA